MKEKIRWLLFIAAIAMVGQNMYETGIRMGNVLIGGLVVACLALNIYIAQKRRRDEQQKLLAEQEAKRARRRARKAGKKAQP